MEELRCCECFEYLSCEPVMLKGNGESVCGRCCVVDDSKLARNKAYEIVSSTVVFPCRYSKDGCKKKVKMEEMKKHEEECQYFRYNCPVLPPGGCYWRGNTGSLLEHFKDSHSDCVVDHPYKFHIDHSENFDRNSLMAAYGFLFLLQMRYRKAFETLTLNLKFLGTPTLSALFQYKLEVSNGTDFVIKNRTVQNHNKLLQPINPLTINMKNIKDDLGELSKVLFTLHASMNDINCINCKQLLITSPIYTTDHGYKCENCSIIKYKYCKYFEKGCTFKDNELNLNKHEKWLCSYSSTSCTKCRIVLKDVNLLEHDMEKHANFKINSSEVTLESLFANVNYRAVLVCYGIRFYCIWKLGEDLLDFDVVSTLSDKFENKKYKCEVAVSNPGDEAKVIKEEVNIDDLNEYYFDWDLTLRKGECRNVLDDDKSYNLLFKITDTSV